MCEKEAILSGARPRYVTLKPPDWTYDPNELAEADRLIDQLGGPDASSFCLKLIHITGIATVPGTTFYHKAKIGNNQVRFCFAKSQATLKEICLRLNKLKRQETYNFSDSSKGA